MARYVLLCSLTFLTIVPFVQLNVQDNFTRCTVKENTEWHGNPQKIAELKAWNEMAAAPNRLVAVNLIDGAIANAAEGKVEYHKFAVRGAIWTAHDFELTCVDVDQHRLPLVLFNTTIGPCLPGKAASVATCTLPCHLV